MLWLGCFPSLTTGYDSGNAQTWYDMQNREVAHGFSLVYLTVDSATVETLHLNRPKF